jgi:diguanylate cyclase (GGDEF)-like protein
MLERLRLCEDGERGRIVDMTRRLRPAARRSGAVAVAAAVVGIPTFGISPVLGLLIAGAMLEGTCVVVARSDRPELAVTVSWIAGVALAAGSIALAGGPRLYLLPLFAYPMILIAVLLPERVVAAAALVTVTAMVGLCFALAGAGIERFPPAVLYPIVTVLVATLGASLAREKDVASRRSAFFDDLTGLPNRASLAARIGELAHQATARGESVAVLIADIDHFKSINDRHGHARGDGVLAAVGARMAAVLAGGSLYRLGGEEFVVLLPGASPDDARRQGERLREAVRATPVDDVRVTISLGVAVSEPPGFDFERVFAVADDALYRAKRTGRDRMCCAEASQTVVTLHAAPSAQRRGRDAAAGDPAPRQASAESVLLARVARDQRGGGGWLVRDRQQRAQLVTLAQRSQLLGLLVIYPCALAAVLAAAPSFGWWIPVPPTIGAAVLVGTVAALPRLQRPERALAVAWVVAQLCAAAGWLVAHSHPGVSMLVALPALGLLVAAFSPVFPPRVVAAGTALSGLLIVAVAYGYDAGLASHDPGIVAIALALTVTVAVVGCTLGRSTLDHLEVGVVDELTGMLNRTALKARTAELEGTPTREAQIALIVGDLDQLKRINDELGHATGDTVLQEVSRRVRRELRTFDTVYRVGGDEFVALLPSIEEDAATVAERLRVAVREPPIADTAVTVSLGVAVCPPGEAFDYASLFARADHALYEAKRAGRDRVCCAGAEMSAHGGGLSIQRSA